jgi:dipeptidyl aminopeptidase/acylaminoacyl peptidase
MGGEERRLTDFGSAFTGGRALADAEPFTATSPDGTEVEAWVMRPAAFEEGRRYPALLNIHGGPFTQYGNRFFDEFQIQAGAGYVVVYSNPRGSSGYSEAWGRAIRGPTAPDDPGSGWGGVDYEDLMAVVDEALARFPFIDPDRIGVLGGSYGGYMTSWIAGHTDRFKAGCSERSCNNLLTMEHTSDIAGSFRTEIGVSHLDDPEEYRRESPITYVREMTTPLLILHSEVDLRCPVEQAEELFVALRMLGRTPEFVRFPGESHELSRSGSPQHRTTRLEILLDFFGRHLGAAPS